MNDLKEAMGVYDSYATARYVSNGGFVRGRARIYDFGCNNFIGMAAVVEDGYIVAESSSWTPAFYRENE